MKRISLKTIQKISSIREKKNIRQTNPESMTDDELQEAIDGYTPDPLLQSLTDQQLLDAIKYLEQANAEGREYTPEEVMTHIGVVFDEETQTDVTA